MTDSKEIGIEFTSKHDIKLMLCTWNVGNEAPCESLDPWVPEGGGGYDIIVVGVQEATYKHEFALPYDELIAKKRAEREEAAAADDSDGEKEDLEKEQAAVVVKDDKPPKETSSDLTKPKSTRMALSPNGSRRTSLMNPGSHSFKFFDRVAHTLGDSYVSVHNSYLMQMGLIVCVKTELQHMIKNVEGSREATGLAGIVGNKGGLVVKFDFHNTTLAFCTTHLAAHRGEKYLQARNDDVREIFDGALVGNKKLDFASQFTHVFFMGDMNYRIDMNTWAVAEGKENPNYNQIDMFTKVLNMINEEFCKKKDEPSKLPQYDELSRMIKSGTILHGFKEGPINFSPTFKVHRYENLHYTHKRVPSYCDRILWKSMSGHTSQLNQTSYKSFEKIYTSDHKPVHATFSLSQPLALRFDEKLKNGPVIRLTNVSATGLKASDINGKSDPYLKFFSFPPKVFLEGGGKSPMSKHITRDLNPVFTDDMIPLLRPKLAGGKNSLDKVTLIIAVLDYDITSDDDLLGVVMVPFSDILQTSRNASRTSSSSNTSSSSSSNTSSSSSSYSFDLPVVCSSTIRGNLKGTIDVIWPMDEDFSAVNVDKKSSNICCTIV